MKTNDDELKDICLNIDSVDSQIGIAKDVFKERIEPYKRDRDRVIKPLKDKRAALMDAYKNILYRPAGQTIMEIYTDSGGD